MNFDFPTIAYRGSLHPIVSEISYTSDLKVSGLRIEKLLNPNSDEASLNYAGLLFFNTLPVDVTVQIERWGSCSGKEYKCNEPYFLEINSGKVLELKFERLDFHLGSDFITVGITKLRVYFKDAPNLTNMRNSTVPLRNSRVNSVIYL